MRARDTMAACIVVCLISTCLDAADDTRQPPSLDAAVSYVAAGGRWQVADEQGGYRVIVRDLGFDHVMSRVWLEWLSQSVDGPRVRTSVPIVEINQHVGLSVGSPIVLVSPKGTEIQFHAVESHDPAVKHLVRIRPGGPSKYSIQDDRE